MSKNTYADFYDTARPTTGVRGNVTGLRLLNRNEEARLLKQWAWQEFGNNLKDKLHEMFTFDEAVELMNQYPIEWGEYVRAHTKT